MICSTLEDSTYPNTVSTKTDKGNSQLNDMELTDLDPEMRFILVMDLDLG